MADEHNTRGPSKEMVELARDVRSRTEAVTATHEIGWLVESARSLAGEVLSQAGAHD